MASQRLVHRKMDLTVVLTFVLATVVKAQTTQALVHWPWFCLYGNADAATGTVWVELQLCRYNLNFYIAPPNISHSKVTFGKGLCLDAGLVPNSEVKFTECTEGAPGQQWTFNPSLGAAKKGAGADSPDAGQLMLMMDPSMNGPQLCLVAPKNFAVGQRASLQPCKLDNMNVWMFPQPPPPNARRLVMPEVGKCGAPERQMEDWTFSQAPRRAQCCLGMSANEHGVPHAEECVEDMASQFWVPDGDRIHPATSPSWCLASDGGALEAACDDSHYELTWSLNESSGRVTDGAGDLGNLHCLSCPEDNYCSTQHCQTQHCAGDDKHCSKFVWSTAAIEVGETTEARNRIDGSSAASEAQKGQLAAAPQEYKKKAQPQPMQGPPESGKVAHERSTEEVSI